MAVAVVDQLEVVDVDEQHADEPVGAPLARERVAAAVVEERAVRQLRERVVKSAVAELILELLARADVARGQDRARETLVANQAGRDRLDVAPAAVTMAQAPFDAPRRLAGPRRRLRKLVAVVRSSGWTSSAKSFPSSSSGL